MQHKLKSKKIIVTGASSGIGEQLCWQIAKNGGIPIMLARSTDKLSEIQLKLKDILKADSFIYQVDLLEKNEIESTVKQILSEHKQIHGLINNAGMGVFDYVMEMKGTDVLKMFQLNVFSSMHLTQLLIPHFRTYQQGHIINVVSQAAKISTPKSAAYGASKQALLAFTNTLRQEVRKDHIFVTAVNLGPVRTNFFATADPGGTYQKNVKRYMLDPANVAKKITSHLFYSKREINLPIWMEIGSFFYKLFPGLMELLLKGQFNKK